MEDFSCQKFSTHKFPLRRAIDRDEFRLLLELNAILFYLKYQGFLQTNLYF